MKIIINLFKNMFKNTIKLKFVIIFSILMYIMMASTVFAAITAQIDIQDSFSLGEEIFYDYTLISDNDTQVIIVPYIKCPYAPTASLMERVIILTKNVSYRDIYSGVIIDESIEPQTCTANIQILNPFQQEVSKEFKIATNPSFSFTLQTCKDQNCSQKSKIFIKSEDIYLDYSSDVAHPLLTATLTYPNNTTKQISLPTSIKPDQLGTYTLEVTASKQDYKTITKKEQFAVIEKHADIQSAVKSDGEIISDDGGEITKEDIKEVTKKVVEERPVPWQIIGIIFGIIIGVILVVFGTVMYIKMRKNNRNNF